MSRGDREPDPDGGRLKPLPHSREVRETSHERHDPLLMAALAAGDLAGTDRDQAITLARTCTECAALHDDLLALARATAAAPAPFAIRPRDVRLTRADAARLRPNGWRRLVAAVSKRPSALSRPMGVGLATLGLVGLLVGNVQLGGTTSSATPEAAASGATSQNVPPLNYDMVAVPSGVDSAAGGAPGRASAAGSGGPGVASSAPFQGAYPVPAASSGGPAAAASSAGPDTAALSGGKSATTETLSGELGTGQEAVATGDPARPLNLLFGAAVVLGLGILVAARWRGRRTA